MDDPCADLPPPQVIQLTLGDDWGLAFNYLDKTNAAIVLDTDTVEGLLYVPFTSIPLLLDVTSGRAKVVDQPGLSFALGLENAMTGTLQADTTPPVSHLQIVRVSGSLRRSIGHFALQLLKGNAFPELITQPVYLDPLTGDRVILVGYTTLVPVPPGE
jgi:hypothetical protein